MPTVQTKYIQGVLPSDKPSGSEMPYILSIKEADGVYQYRGLWFDGGKMRHSDMLRMYFKGFFTTSTVSV